MSDKRDTPGGRRGGRCVRVVVEGRGRRDRMDYGRPAATDQKAATEAEAEAQAEAAQPRSRHNARRS